MKRIIRLTERDLSRIVKRVINESTPPKINFSDLIGKTVVFKLTNPKVAMRGDRGEVDEWTTNELDTQLDGRDSYIWNEIKNKDIKGEITDFRIITGDDVVYVEIKQYNNGNMFDVNGFYYECGSETFSLSGYLKTSIYKGNGFWNGKFVNGEWTNNMLAEKLENRLPCGGFDLSKSDSMDDDDIEDTLS
jgi:hypothetical protein